ncbi:fasciclin domain-containing protein [Xylanibacter muris]|uniref:FAS1 domain-containing protein n=1 Tax=Xylanibacter muris TaxID=2736290 RepID=A0ABX2ALL4_9BACT|nr:fasciclin domain-containing protein [Xylanibacter muris]NPD92000.1 hypothetical protein [Xylanibacter muris]
MNNNILKSIFKAAGMIAVPACLTLSACTAEPDDSNLYTFTGQTIEDYIVANEADYSSFNYILQRSGYDRLLRTYGTYTCFLPDNKAVQNYIDSLYDDEKNIRIPHNGMTEKSLEGLTDSLCADIAKFHLAGSVYKTIELETSGRSVLTLLGRTIITALSEKGISLNDGSLILNGKANRDIEVENGVIHLINSVIPRSNSLVSSEIKDNEMFSIFSQALDLTGLADSLEAEKKDIKLQMPTRKATYYTPTECKLGFTVFAEPDSILKKYGIEDINGLIARANDWYAKCATGTSASADQGWYDYYRNNNIEVSTGDDYTSPYNALNMFVRYHILKSAVNQFNLTTDFNVYRQAGYNGDTYEYYETMLPKTLIKIWRVDSEKETYINRYRANNTLTDGLETMGSASMHELIRKGVKIQVNKVMQPLNGFIYPIDDILLYESYVPQGVLHERMRFDALALLPETMNNGLRGLSYAELQSLSGNSEDTRVRFPVNYFDNVRVYNGDLTKIDMNFIQNKGTGNNFLLYKGDSFQGMGAYDLAIKLPPVPDGEYEIRLDVTTFGIRGSMLQYYLGTSSELSDLQAVDIPIDMRMNSTQYGTTKEEQDPRLTAIGYTSLKAEDSEEDYADKGLTSDREMRIHGYMRGPLSVTKEGQDMSQRFACYSLRRILVKKNLTQRDYWIRLKTVLPEVTEGKYQLDYIEIVPLDVVQHPRYLEDMY